MTLPISFPLKNQINSYQKIKIIDNVPVKCLLNLTNYDVYLLKPNTDFQLILGTITGIEFISNVLFTKTIIIDSSNMLDDSITISFDNKTINLNNTVFLNFDFYKSYSMVFKFVSHNLGRIWNGSLFRYFSFSANN